MKTQPQQITNALLGKESGAREKAVAYVTKHLEDDVDADLDDMTQKIHSTMQVVRIALEDKVFKVLSKGIDLLEKLTISGLLECELGFQAFTHSLIENDVMFMLSCRVEDNQKKLREKCTDALMMLA